MILFLALIQLSYSFILNSIKTIKNYYIAGLRDNIFWREILCKNPKI